MLTDLYVRDKTTNKIHRVGSDKHDSLWVDDKGRVHYQNLQNGDGCCEDNEKSGYEFVKTEGGMLGEYAKVEEIAEFAEAWLEGEHK